MYFRIFLLLSASFILFFISCGQANIEQAEVDQTNTKQDYERILSYNVDVVVRTNSSLVVTETIVVNAMGENISRGIYRTFPTKRNLNNQSYPLKYKIISVKRDGQIDDFHEEEEEDWLKLYIGRSSITLSPRVYTYEIKYEVPKQIGFFDTYDELYWNVTGTEWIFPIEEVKATVHLPFGADIIQKACYTGVFGSNESHCQVSLVDDNTIVWEAKNLSANEGLTVAVGFEKGLVMPPPPPRFVKKYGIMWLLIVAFCCFAYYFYDLWKKYGVDPEKPTVYPMFSPPHNLSPSTLSYLYYEKFKETSMTAALTHLAVKKHITIEEVDEIQLFGGTKPTYFRINKLKDPTPPLAEEEKVLMNRLFLRKNNLLIDGKYTSTVENASLNFKKSVISQFEALVKEGRNLKLLLQPALLFFTIFILSYIFASLSDGNKGIIGLGIGAFVMLGLPIAFLFILTRVVKSKESYAKESYRMGMIVVLGILILFNLKFFTSIYLSIHKSGNIGITSTLIFFVLGIIGFLVMHYLIKRPSEEKLKIQAEIEGFKMYLSAAENEQIKFHNAPEFTPQLFEAYLPYALVFEVDKIWGKRFEHLLTRSSLDYTPTWYTGSSYSPVLFGSVLGSQLTTLVNASATDPSSSYGGGSSSSGSSGSGSSGGGGGGGGGGGW